MKNLFLEAAVKKLKLMGSFAVTSLNCVQNAATQNTAINKQKLNRKLK